PHTSLPDLDRSVLPSASAPDPPIQHFRPPRHLVIQAIPTTLVRPLVRSPCRRIALSPRPLHPIPPAVLRHIQGRVRLRRQLLQRGPRLWAGSDAERSAQRPHAAIPVPRCSPQPDPDSFGNASTSLQIGLRQPDGKFFSPDASREVPGADLTRNDA